MAFKQSYSDKGEFEQTVGKLVKKGFRRVRGNQALKSGEYRLVVAKKIKNSNNQTQTSFHIEWQPKIFSQK